ncbi:phosphoserine transaminase [Tessaracoccus sp. MC1865]|uniref:phosphoserine transaminase n=1 Tax=Tessaracoccus sp. MC1865 TaxID=2760310 RepID=UPI0016016E6A|nr:phosphoserine transaminase [Tessaracoccus sp. MC1865]MBB1482519.1 phosphoserine transaminase [Tessaracoccus sp. MC1865]QTO38027.1 phosphoserine transaminase [Tessaracoccus sp. MC1865]
MMIPDDLLPLDGRFGSGPAKVRPEALDYLGLRSDIMGTSHRQAPVRELVATIQAGLAELYRLPDGYEVVLGNGGSTLFWDMAVFSLIEQRSAHGVFGEFTRKFARAASRAPHLDDPAIFEAPVGGVALPESRDSDVHAWAQNETSTGAAAPVVRRGDPDSIVLIDATSAAGGIDADISETDVYYFAPQKNFSSDGGLWLAFASPAAVERAERIKAGGRYIPEILDFSTAVSNSRKNQTLNTPALATLLLLEDQIQWMLDLGGMAEVAARCRRSSQTLYDWAEARSFASPFVTDPAHRSPVVATIDLDESVNAATVIAALRDNGIRDVDPYRALNRNQLRVGCYASVDPDDVEALTACLDYVIERL